MTVMTLEAVLRRERAIIAVALGAVAFLAWSYILMLLWQTDHAPVLQATHDVGDVDVSGLAANGMTMLATPRFLDFPVLVLLWSVTLIGIMTPGVAPMILLYARVARQAAAKGRPLAATSWFAGGYLLAWIGFATIASGAQIWLQHQALLTGEMDQTSRLFSGFVLLAAGLFQWGPLKDACFNDSRAPLHFIQRHGGFRPAANQSLRLGFQHGAYCIGSCWALMALLFVGGVMNMLWVAGLSILILLEKMTPVGRDVARLIGIALLAGGSWMLLGELV